MTVATADYSIEVLYHFKCGSCAMWWTVSDIFCDLATMTEVSCPGCAERQAIGEELRNEV